MTTANTLHYLVIFLAIFLCIDLVQAQDAKTIKLTNGEEIVDISGEWDAQIENYGPWSVYGNYQHTVNITLKGNSFVGIRMTSPAKESFRGELHRDGIQKLQLLTGMGTIDAKGQISQDGNTIILDDGEKTRSTLKRK